MFALIAGLAGLVCGYFIAAALLPDVAASLRGLYGPSIPGQLVLKREWWLAGVAISVLGALGASAASLIKAVRLPILASAINGRRVSIFNRADGAEHPMRGVELTNSTGLQLIPGPISVFDGAAYAGDAQIGHITTGQVRDEVEDGKDQRAVERGQRGGVSGGNARAAPDRVAMLPRMRSPPFMTVEALDLVDRNLRHRSLSVWRECAMPLDTATQRICW